MLLVFVQYRELQLARPQLFYRLLCRHAQEILPLVYTPTVGAACQQYSRLPLVTVGLYVNANHRGKVQQLLESYQSKTLGIGQGSNEYRVSYVSVLLLLALANNHHLISRSQNVLLLITRVYASCLTGDRLNRWRAHLGAWRSRSRRHGY